MPRKARVKSPESIYHITCRSLPEVLLFRDNEDKDHYLNLLKRYTEKNNCSLYAYCIMDNHLHLHFDPKGYDVSKFMHSLNTAYVRYYNKKHQRYGPLFQDRFVSKILSTDNYNLAVSAYIHNNPHSILGYWGKEENYPYSSYSIYLGIFEDSRKLIDKGFMMSLFNIYNKELFPVRYHEFVTHQRDFKSLQEIVDNLDNVAENEYVSGRKIILRELSPSNTISFISDKMMISDIRSLSVSGRHRLIKYRAFTAYVLRVFCGLSYKDICSYMFNISFSGCSRLCDKGFELTGKDPFFLQKHPERVNRYQ